NYAGNLVGGTGNDNYVFFGPATGSVTIAEAAQPGPDTSVDTIDFSPYQAAGIVLDLAQTTPQTVAPGLSLPFTDAMGMENAIGTRLDDQLHGNARPNVLLGAALPDARDALAATLQPVAQTQWVLVTFDAAPANGIAYDATMRQQVLSGLQALYAPFGF